MSLKSLFSPAHVKEGSQTTAVLDVEKQEIVEEAPDETDKPSNEYGHAVVASRSPESNLDCLQNAHSNSNSESQLRDAPQPPQGYTNLLGVGQGSLKETHPPSASSAVHQDHTPSPLDPAPNTTMFQSARNTHINGTPVFINVSFGRRSSSQEDERQRDQERQRQAKLYRWSEQHQFLLVLVLVLVLLLLPLYGYLLRAETTTPVQVVSASPPPPPRPMLPRHRPKRPFLPPPPPLLRPTPPPCSSPS